jgi:signal transduction histidine kinase
MDHLKTEFFANVSHELRTPLTLILAPVESLLAAENDNLNEKQRQTVGIIHNNAIRLLQMVNGLLDFSKLLVNKTVVNREPIHIIELSRSLFDDFQGLSEKKGLHAEFNCDVAEPVVAMDRYLYERIVFNLLANAIKFTNTGGTVQLALSQHADTLSIAVSDTGIGIALEDCKQLFQKFRQVDSSSTRRFEGTGIGLALVKEFADLLNGNVTVESQVGKGSVFTVVCQASPVLETVSTASHLQQIPSYLAPLLPIPHQVQDSYLPKVLIAEDNPELALFIAETLSSLCRVQVVPDGLQALKVTRQWFPDLVVCDVMMPKMDGFGFTQEVKASKETALIPVVLLTAMTSRDALLRGWEVGADDYLFKPFHPLELQARVKSLLAMSHWREKSEAYRKKKEDLEQFTHIASHDLKEPLRKMNVFSKFLLDSCAGKLSQEDSDYLHAIHKSAAHMIEMIEALMRYTCLDAAETNFIQSDFNLMVAEVVDGLHVSIAETGASVTIGLLPQLKVEPALMKLVFHNLLQNSLKYRKTGQIPTIHVEAVRQDRQWRFSVKDNGIGFDRSQNENIFIMFKRLHTRDKYEGEGMGLAICKRIIENHGGRIWAEATPDLGSTFYFTLFDSTAP